MNPRHFVIAIAVLLIFFPATGLRGQKKDFLSEDEEDELREAQDPSKRIEVYLAFAQVRLDRFEQYRTRPDDPKYDTGSYMDSLLGEYISLNDELKSWIEYQFQQNGDMRRGLRALLERGPRQLEQLRQIQQSPGPHASEYSNSLRDAIEDLTDTLDGAAKAASVQEKKFQQMKREEKAEARLTKERLKEEAKRNKEEKKLQKRERKRHAPAESEEN